VSLYGGSAYHGYTETVTNATTSGIDTDWLMDDRTPVSTAKVIVLEGSIRYWVHGVDPTPTVGIPLIEGGEVTLVGTSNITKFLMISTGDDAVIAVTLMSGGHQ